MMTLTKEKYSLWMVPVGNEGATLQSLVSKLSREYDAPLFIPHLTLVANMYADDTEIDSINHKASELVQSIGSLAISLNQYGYKDEEFRSLYLLADKRQLDDVYDRAADFFPQVREEHFKSMPHLSVLYGVYPVETKRRIITQHPLPKLECMDISFELHLTNDPVSSWQRTSRYS